MALKRKPGRIGFCALGHNKVALLQHLCATWAAIAANLQMLLKMGTEVEPGKRAMCMKGSRYVDLWARAQVCSHFQLTSDHSDASQFTTRP